MLTLPKNLAPIRPVVASLLRSNDYISNLYSANDIATILQMAANIGSNTSIRNNVGSNLIVRAFTFDGRSEYHLSYDNCFDYDDDDYVIFYLTRKRADGKYDHVDTAIG